MASPRYTVAPLALVAMCVVMLSACGADASSTKQAQTTGDEASSSSASTSVAANSAAEASGVNLPVYPGAIKQAVPAKLATMSHCGHKITLVSYHVVADGQTVAKWYKGRIPGASVIDLGDHSGGGAADETTLQILDANGDAGVVVTQMHFSSAKFAGAAKMIGADKTSIGLETYHPPMGSDYVALVKQATGSDVAAKQAAKDKLTSMCASSS